MKRTVLACFCLIASFGCVASRPIDVDEVVLQSFRHLFAAAEDVKWNKQAGYYFASFEQKGVRAKVMFDKEGTVVSVLRYFQEDRLPLPVISAVKKKFRRCWIFGVTEETVNNETIYHITLENQNNWLIVKSDAYGTLVKEGAFRKAKS
jgi:hypothetical protein